MPSYLGLEVNSFITQWSSVSHVLCCC